MMRLQNLSQERKMEVKLKKEKEKRRKPFTLLMLIEIFLLKQLDYSLSIFP